MPDGCCRSLPETHRYGAMSATIAVQAREAREASRAATAATAATAGHLGLPWARGLSRNPTCWC
jgi:hypothetical protein